MSETESLGQVELARVAIVGRPNVGKSTLFNILTNTRKAVVKNQPGVTRDILVESVDLWGKAFDLIDTGGITDASDEISKHIKEQVSEFIEMVDLILIVADGRQGLMPEDRELLRLVRSTGKPFLLVVNKIDSVHEEDIKKAEFYELSEEVVGASFETRRGISDILEWIHPKLPTQVSVPKEGLTIAIVGKPNAGKSSLTNWILGENRMMVSAKPGTTVDAVDSPFVYKGRKYTLVDTAGLRRAGKQQDDLEVIASFKSQESIRKADLVILVIDGLEGPAEQDARILSSVIEDHKAIIIAANKSDLGNKEIEEYRRVFKEQAARTFHFFPDLPIVFTSAKTGQGVRELLDSVEWLEDKMNFHVSTSELNDFFFDTIRKAPAPVWGVNNVKFYYLTQTRQVPPAFIAFANHPEGVDNAYRRFLVKQLKERFDLWGLPLRIFVMKSRRRS